MENIVKIPPKDFLSEVECEKKRRLKFLKTARGEVKCGFKYKDWCSKEFKLFDSHNETLVRKLEQEQENVSQLMTVGTGRRPCSRPTTALRCSSHCLIVSDILLELDKYLKTDENVEIGFETSVFCTKNKTTRHYLR